MTFGPNPWQQRSWDARAAGNFICGGAGAGLLVFTALSGAQGAAAALLTLVGLGLTGIGLLLVWLEIGRPWRAINVLRNPRSSWMSREAWVAMALFPVGLLAAWGLRPAAWLVAALALLFVLCQARMLQAAKGIPAWREPLTTPLIVLTGLAEGGALFWMAEAWHGLGSGLLGLAFGALVLMRALLSRAWRTRVAATWVPRPVRWLDKAAVPLALWGGLLPLVLITLAAVTQRDATLALAAWALAGALVLASGAWFKFSLVTRAAFNQGFTLVQLPVRGARR
jgi:phenylacetyl-CoA:acceptor oxidoreductase subunit 2